MVYNEKFVVVVVCNGRILREVRKDGQDFVRLPFSSDYGLRFKNFSSQRAVVSIEIDGQDVLNSNRIIVPANETIDLDGFMDGNQVKHAFRFIKKTDEIVAHRGDRVEDGFIRVEWQFEKQPPEIQVTEHIHHDYWYHDWYYPYWPYRYPWHPRYPHDFYGPYYSTYVQGDKTYAVGQTQDSILRSMGGGTQSCSNQISSNINSAQNFTAQNNTLQPPEIGAEEGITVHGKDVNQQWSSAWMGELETTKHSIIFRLVGQTEKAEDSKTTKTEEVKKPVFVDSKIICSSCGKSNKSDVKFCPNCGTNLQ
jgi:hypothetical protein